MNNKAFVNTLTIILALAVVLGGLSLMIFNPSLSGFASKDKKVDKEVLEVLNSQNEADVIVILKDDNQGFSVQNQNDGNQRIKQKQDSVLSKLDYSELKKGVSASNSKDFKLKYKYSTTNAFSGKLTKEGLLKLENDPNVEKIVPVRKVSISLTNSVPLIEADKVWNININNRNITGSGQSICIIDTGVDYTHESLGSCSAINVSEHKCKVIAGYDFVNADGDPLDDHNHGTHVAGIAAANGNIIGVARGANIIAIKALDATGSGDDADVIAGIDWCTNNATRYNISVISMSLGDQTSHTSADCPTTMDSSLQSAFNAGLTIVAASGNEGSNSGINYPACSPYAISVGASDNTDAMASLTNTHQLLDVVAPGISIVSTKRGGGTLTLSGTSMATPHAAGVAALIYQYEKEYNNKNTTSREVESLLKQSNVSISDSGLSFPRIDALIAVRNILNLNSSSNSASGNQVGVKFSTSTSLENVSEAFTLRHNFISLNSSKYSSYNKSANVTFYNLTFTKTPVVLMNGNVCTDCNIADYSSGALTFTVSHFTNYTSGANSQLHIFDQADSRGGSRNAKVNLQTYFYANYTNITSNEGISTATCDINFTDLNSAMTFNSSSTLFELNRTFLNSATYQYNVSCSDSNFENLNTTDSIFVAPACLNQTPNTNITIALGQTVNCTAENIVLQNQSIDIFGTLYLNNTLLTIESSGSATNHIATSDQSNLSVVNSTINGTINTLTIFNYNSSKINITNSNLININIDARGNSTLYVINSTINGSITLRGNSNNSLYNVSMTGTFDVQGASRNTLGQSNNIFDSFFKETSTSIVVNSILNRVYFRESSYVEIRNSTINNISQLGNAAAQTPIINFTLPTSNITNITEIRLNSTIYGYVDLPTIAATYTAISVKRFYPLQANYSTGIPASNRTVNVTNATNGVELWSGTTDATGFANINLTITQNMRFDNFSVSINPQQNISLLSDTPLIFTLTDNPPAVFDVNPLEGSNYNTSQTIEISANVTDDLGISTVRANITLPNLTIQQITLNLVTGNKYNNSFTIPQLLGEYDITFIANDTGNNINSTTTTFFVGNDAVKPAVSFIHPNISNEDLAVNYNATISDNIAISYCNLTINNIVNSTMSITSTLTNTTLTMFTPGTYNFLANCTDTSGNYNDTSITSITIRDITPPYFNETIINQIISEGSSLFLQINASDNVAVDSYSVNDTAHFTINKLTGLLQNNTALTPRTYWLNVSVNDTSGNRNSTRFNITIIDLSPPIIANISASGITNQSSKINWTTNENSNTTVIYGINRSQELKSEIDNSVTLHPRTLSNLLNNTLYFYNVTSCSAGGCATNGTFNFTTSQNSAPGQSGGGSGGGSGSVTITPACSTSWYCDLWSACENGEQERLCQDINGCLPDKIESQSCTVQAPIEKTGGHSGILEEPIKKTAASNPGIIADPITESAKFVVMRTAYMWILWAIMGLFLILLIARKVDTFPMIMWKEEKYIEKKDVHRAEMLFDRLISRFSKSRDRERKYADEVERITKKLEEIELVSERGRLKFIDKIKAKPEMKKEMTSAIDTMDYNELLKEYRKTFTEYLSTPENREQLQDKLSKLKEHLFKSINKGKDQ